MKHETITRRGFLAVGAAGAVAAAGTGCHTLKAEAAWETLPYAARLEVAHPSKVRILQLTDIHWGTETNALEKFANGSSDRIIAEVMERAKPDLVLVTGDVWSGNREPGRESRMREAVAKMAGWGVPWAFTWGNHDQLILENEGHRALTEAAHSLYRGADTGGNYVVDLVDSHGCRVCQLVCLNSRGEGLGKEQQAWMDGLAADSKGEAPLRFGFFHIPIKQYVDIWDNHAASGLKGERQCIESEDGSSLACLRKLGVRACFCGHDHVNDYSGVIDGVELVYGRATGIGGYGGERVAKGGKLITVNCRTGRYDWVSVVPGERDWQPRRGVQEIVPPEKKRG